MEDIEDMGYIENIEDMEDIEDMGYIENVNNLSR